MPLLSFWKNNREEVLKMGVDQIVSSAGDGNLRDGTAASEEFRKFLRVVPSENLSRYARCNVAVRSGEQADYETEAHGNRRKNLILMLCVVRRTAPVASGAFLFDTICMSVCTLESPRCIF